MVLIWTVTGTVDVAAAFRVVTHCHLHFIHHQRRPLPCSRRLASGCSRSRCPRARSQLIQRYSFDSRSQVSDWRTYTLSVVSASSMTLGVSAPASPVCAVQ
ncbi:hypothetical protein J3A83DRAFT_4258047 [Scleroderma citrinum]